MQPSPPPSAAPANPQKARTGLNRIWHAAGYSLEGLRAGWNEKAFRQEAISAMVLLPVAVWASRAAAGEGVELPGGWSMPTVLPVNAVLKEVVDVLFNIGASAFLAGLALHVFGAVKNHFLLKNDTLKRMLGKHVEL